MSYVETLMNKDNRLARRFLEIVLQPLDLIRRNVGIRPLEIVSTIRLTITTKASIQHDEVKTADVKRVIRLHSSDTVQEFIFREGRNTVISQNIMFVARKSRQYLIDAGKVLFLDFDGVGRVDKVAEFN